MRKHLALVPLLLVFLAVSVSYGLLNPLGEAPDEQAHVDLIRFIAQEGHLPRSYEERDAAGYKSDSPMLYHFLLGSALRWVDYAALPRLKDNSTNPRRLLIEDGLSPFAVIHTEDESLPYRGIVLAGHLSRMVSALLSTGTLMVIYAAVLTACPKRRWMALGATAIVAAIPGFHFIASAVNDDNLLGLLAALFTLFLMRAWREPARVWNYVWAGVCLGLALTTKYSAAPLPLLVTAMLVLMVHRGALGWRPAVARFGIFVAALLGTSAWWFAFVEWNFNEVREAGLLVGLVKPLLAGERADASMRQVASFITGGALATPLTATAPARGWLEWVASLSTSFWLPGSPLDHQVGVIMCAGLTVLSVLALGGLLRAFGLRRNTAAGGNESDVPGAIVILLLFQILLLLAFPALRYYLTGNVEEAGQGRHVLFPASVAAGLLLVAGLSSWFAPTRRRLVGPVVAGVLLSLSLANFFGLILPAFPERLPVRTTADAADGLPNPVHIRFGKTVELAGYEVGPVSRSGGLPVTLTWRSLAYSSQDYLTDLVMLSAAPNDSGGDEREPVVGRWLGYPVDGRYPTRAWEPGDVVRDEVWLPLSGLNAGEYRLCVRLLPAAATGSIPPIADDCRLLTRVSIPALSGAAAGHALQLPDGRWEGFSVWNAGEVDAELPVFRYRSTILVSLSDRAPGGDDGQPAYAASLVGPDGTDREPMMRAGSTYGFLVGAHWRAGAYRLRLRVDDRTVDSEPALMVRLRQRTFDVPLMSKTVNASFGGEVRLLGFDLPERRVASGGTLPITLYWQAERDVHHHYIVFNHLLGADLRQWGGRDRIPGDYYSTALWAAGEVVRDDYWVPVDTTAPPGVYRLDVGLYEQGAGQMISVPIIADGSPSDAGSVTLASVKVAGPPPGVTIETPTPQHRRQDQLGGVITLLGYDLSQTSSVLNLTLYWRCDDRPSADYTTFVHVRGTSGRMTGQAAQIVAQMDHPPANGAYPTSLWDRGEVIRDAVDVPIPGGVVPGDYEVVVGLYDSTTGARLAPTSPVTLASVDGAITLATVAIGKQ